MKFISIAFVIFFLIASNSYAQEFDKENIYYKALKSHFEYIEISNKEKDITHDFFDKNYSQLFKSPHFHFSNPNGRFLYMPQMYESVLYDTQAKRKYILPEASLNNIFLNNKYGIFLQEKRFILLT